MGLRIPHAWEADQTPRKVETDVDTRVSVDSVEMRAARRFVDTAESDPNRRRRGASGAADWVHREMTRQGITVTRDQVRDRVNRARAVTAAKKRQ